MKQKSIAATILGLVLLWALPGFAQNPELCNQIIVQAPKGKPIEIELDHFTVVEATPQGQLRVYSMDWDAVGTREEELLLMPLENLLRVELRYVPGAGTPVVEGIAKVMPDFTTGTLTVNGGDALVLIFSSSGLKLGEEMLKASSTLDLHKFGAGLMIVEVEGITFKFNVR